MQNPYLSAALDIVKAQAASRPMTEEEINAAVKNLTATLTSLDNPAAAEETPAEPAGLKLIDGFNPKRSIQADFVLSGLDGKKYKLLTKKHFEANGTTKDDYLTACGLPKGTSLICKSLMTMRSEKMKDMKLWERKKTAQPATPAAEAPAAVADEATASAY